MCLGTKLSEKELKKYKAKGKKCGYIWVWKAAIDTGKRFQPWWMDAFKYKAGLNHAREDANSEQKLHHAFCDKKSAKNYATGPN